MPDEKPKTDYVKFSITLRGDVAEKLEQIQQQTGLDRSGAIALAIKLLNLKKLRDENGG
jgi:metal-responsive CopG/Arc/MetJ family transcriptional regulator